MGLLISSFLVIVGIFLVGLVFQCILLLILRIRITAVKIFFGPTPLICRIAECKISLGWIPSGCSVAYDVDDFRDRHWLVRLLVHFFAAIVYLALAVAFLGLPEAWHQALYGFIEIPLGAWQPIDKGGNYLELWGNRFTSSPMIGIGIVAAKLAAFQLLPIGGTVITQIAANLGDIYGHEPLQKWAMFNAILSFGIMILWVFSALYLVITR